MRTSEALKHARKAKNDEFYTRYRFIEDELRRHDATLKGKSILCPCDHPMYSEFGSWFIDNFNRLHLKELVVRGRMNGESMEAVIHEAPDGCHSVAEACDASTLNTIHHLKECSYDDSRCTDLIDDGFVVVTNPPFSTERQLLRFLYAHNAECILVANVLLLPSKDSWQLAKTGWIGQVYSGSKSNTIFGIPGGRTATLSMACWVSTDYKEFVPPFMKLTRVIDDNTIWVSSPTPGVYCKSYRDIPRDYDGVIYVPVTSLVRLNRQQFDIIGLDKDIYPSNVATRYLDGNGEPMRNFVRFLVRLRKPDIS